MDLSSSVELGLPCSDKKKMHSTILGSASDVFQKTFKNLKICVILKMRKKSTIITVTIKSYQFCQMYCALRFMDSKQ